MSITRFMASLGCVLRLGFYWSAAAEDNKRLIITIWRDQIHGSRYILLPKEDVAWKKLPGAHELRRHLPLALNGHTEVFGLICTASDDEATTRKREYYDEFTLVKLDVVDEAGEFVAYLRSEVSAEDIRSGAVYSARPISGAEEDIYQPAGNLAPERKSAVGSFFVRDSMVRNYVIKCANGSCEYCGALGFKTSGGTYYLEAHHVLALSDGGPDTIHNVIALCPNHHREAHFGEARETLNAEMLGKLKTIRA